MKGHERKVMMYLLNASSSAFQGGEIHARLPSRGHWCARRAAGFSASRWPLYWHHLNVHQNSINPMFSSMNPQQHGVASALPSYVQLPGGYSFEQKISNEMFFIIDLSISSWLIIPIHSWHDMPWDMVMVTSSEFTTRWSSVASAVCMTSEKYFEQRRLKYRLQVKSRPITFSYHSHPAFRKDPGSALLSLWIVIEVWSHWLVGV